MSDFNFSLDEIMKGDAAPFNREISKQLRDPHNPMKTTASELGGGTDFLSTLSAGQLLMGVPATSSQDDIYSTLDTMVSTIVGGLQSAVNVEKKVVGFAAQLVNPLDYFLPGDISKQAISFSGTVGAAAGSGIGDVVGAGLGTGDFKGTVNTTRFGGKPPTNQDFIDQCKTQLGKPYTTNNPQRFGPDQFDCSGFVYYALRHIGITDPQLPSTSQAQWQWCVDDKMRKGGGNITPDQGFHIPGALLIEKGYGSGGHVAVSDGKGSAYAAHGHGVLSSLKPVDPRSGFYNAAGLVPGVAYIGIDTIESGQGGL